MPLSEFLKMLKNESGEKKPTSSSQDLSSLPGSHFAELVWENGPVTMASKTKKSVGNASSSRNWKLDLASSVLDEMPSSVPNGEMDLSQDDEIAPWLNYSPTNNAQPQEYGSQLLPEMSGMTANEPSGHNGFALIDKGVSPNNPIVGSSNRNGPKLDGSSRFGLLASWSSQQANPLVSGVSDIISSNGSINLDSVPGQASTKIQKRDTQTLLNFSNFSRPVVLAGIEAKRKREKEVKENSQNRAKTALVEARSISKNENDLKSLEQTDASFREGGPNDAKHISPVYVGRVSEGEKAVEHGACSSVCSGSSAERASNDLSHSLKRRNRESEESGCPSEDDESAGAKKAGPARGGTGQKRSRAAEVHNLSERRRRDRINEKMRALQELIPNCNKADKASMLDEAIEYLKTLQLQLQIMSMGAGLCMPQMMFPAGMHHHMQHFPQMGLGIGMGMGMGFGMGLPIPPMPRPPPHFSSPGGPINFPAFGHPSPMSVPRTPFVPFSYPPPSPGLNAPRMGMNGEVPSKNLQPRQNADPTQAETTSDQPPNASDDPTVNATNSTNVAGSK